MMVPPCRQLSYKHTHIMATHFFCVTAHLAPQPAGSGSTRRRTHATYSASYPQHASSLEAAAAHPPPRAPAAMHVHRGCLHAGMDTAHLPPRPHGGAYAGRPGSLAYADGLEPCRKPTARQPPAQTCTHTICSRGSTSHVTHSPALSPPTGACTPSLPASALAQQIPCWATRRTNVVHQAARGACRACCTRPVCRKRNDKLKVKPRSQLVVFANQAHPADNKELRCYAMRNGRLCRLACGRKAKLEALPTASAPCCMW